jgi:hypothetical protein
MFACRKIVTLGTGWKLHICADTSHFVVAQRTPRCRHSITLHLFFPLPLSISHQMCLDSGMCYKFLEFLFLHLRHPKPFTLIMANILLAIDYPSLRWSRFPSGCLHSSLCNTREHWLCWTSLGEVIMKISGLTCLLLDYLAPPPPFCV